MGFLFDSSGKKKKNSGYLFSQNTSDSSSEYADQLQTRIGNYETRFAAVGETPPEPKKESNLLLRALDILDRPRNALVNAIQDVSTGENSFMQGLGEGFTGKEKAYVSDLLPEDMNKYAKGIVGFAGDVLADPLTYLTLGTAGVAKGAATAGGRQFLKFAGKPVADVTGITRGIGAAVQKTGIPEALGPVFSTKYIRRSVTAPEELPDIEKARDMIRFLPQRVKGEQQIALDDLTKRWQGISPQAAQEAARIVEAPTELAVKQQRLAAKAEKKFDAPGGLKGKALFVDGKIIYPADLMKKAKQLKENFDPIEDLGEEGLGHDSLYLARSIESGDMEAAKSVFGNGVHITKKGDTFSLRFDADGFLRKNEGLSDADVFNNLFDAAKALKKDGYTGKLEIPEINYTGTINDFLNVKSQPQVKNMVTAAKAVGAPLSKEGIRAAAIAKRLTKETAEKDLAAGVEFEKVPNYLRHLYQDPPEKVQAVLNRWQKERMRLSPKGKFQKERTIPTIQEAKRLGLTPIEDVRILTAVRELEGIRQRAIQGMYRQLQELGENVVRDADKAPPGWKVVPASQLQGKAVHPEVARFLERFNQTMTTETGTKTFVDALSKAQSVWKGLVTTSVPFHLRNALGNFYNNFLAGVVNPQLYAMAGAIQKGDNTIYRLGKNEYTGREILEMFRRQGLEGFGIFNEGNTKTLVREATEKFAGTNTFGRNISRGKLVSASRNVGDTLETNAKLAHFIDKLAKGYTPEQAAESVRKFLFDYSDLTPTEKKIRDFVPFLTWTRKNVPLQLESLVKQPGKATAINKLVQNMQTSMGTEESDMPDWMKSELAIPIKINPDGTQVYLMPDLPVANLNMIGGGQTLRNALGMLTPLAKVPIELGMGRQIFTGAPIEKYPGAMANFGNLQLPAPLAYGLSQFGAMPRTAADIAGAMVDQRPAQSDLIPPQPEKPAILSPLLGSLVRPVNPERERLFKLMDRERQLGDYRRYLEEVKGMDVPTIREIEQAQKKKKRGYLF